MKKRIAYLMFLLVAISLAFSSESFAEDIIQAKVVSVSKRQGKVLVMSRAVGLLKRGDALELNKSCTLEVTKRLKDKALLSMDLCFANKSLRRGRSIVLYRENGSKKIPSADRLESGLGGIDDIPAVPVETSYREKIRINKEKAKVMAEGFYIGLNSAVLNGEVTSQKINAQDTNSNGQIGHQYGLSLGYKQVGVSQFGFTVGGHLNQYANSTQSVRGDVNLTYSLSPKTYAYIGPNISQLTSESIDNFDIGFGGQLGLGVQLFERIGLNLAFVSTRNLAENPNASTKQVDYTITGAEFGIHLTF